MSSAADTKMVCMEESEQTMPNDGSHTYSEFKPGSGMHVSTETQAYGDHEEAEGVQYMTYMQPVAYCYDENGYHTGSYAMDPSYCYQYAADGTVYGADACCYSASTGASAMAAGMNLDDFSDMSDSDDEAVDRREQHIAPKEASLSRVSSVMTAEPAAEPSPTAQKESQDPSDDESSSEDEDSDAESSSASSSEDEEDEFASDEEGCAEPVHAEEVEHEEDEQEEKRSNDVSSTTEERSNMEELSDEKASSTAETLTQDEAEPEEEAEADAAEEARTSVSAENFSIAEMLRWRSESGRPHVDQFEYIAMDIADILPTSSEKSMPRKASQESKTKTIERNQAELQVSANSWVSRQKARRGSLEAGPQEDSNEEIARRLKSILNKLTLERFHALKHQLFSCGITTSQHVRILIEEIFEKAITQHHFIDMYADLCVLIHEHFAVNPISNDAKFSFKRLLLNECQLSFERHLVPPSGLENLDAEERSLAEVRYKTRMLGNIKFVGAIVSRKMLSAKVMIAVIEELLSDPTPEALESLAALLKVVGPVFDTQEWTYRPVFTDIFCRIQRIVDERSCRPRELCLLKDCIELRASGWKDDRPKQIEKPTTLDEVAKLKQAADSGFPLAFKATLIKKKPTQVFNQAMFRSESRKVFIELGYSNDVEEASSRLAALAAPPHSKQAGEICELLAVVAECGRAEARRNGFKTISSLFQQPGVWHSENFAEGLKIFVQDVFPDLQCDVPSLPRILSNELHPELVDLSRSGIIKAADIEVLSSAVTA
eukprot:TRINITY_DN10052_c0_g4_i1.p1 TRINITY_DN10052_c0_g4~~TRINITY_DN10052_c0_g4_i1.p1  ORF type:complete len:774 (-),score=204.74 TRINITY_DN10052_c0_g4_i1:696-3017(-)